MQRPGVHVLWGEYGLAVAGVQKIQGLGLKASSGSEMWLPKSSGILLCRYRNKTILNCSWSWWGLGQWEGGVEGESQEYLLFQEMFVSPSFVVACSPAASENKCKEILRHLISEKCCYSTLPFNW